MRFRKILNLYVNFLDLISKKNSKKLAAYSFLFGIVNLLASTPFCFIVILPLIFISILLILIKNTIPKRKLIILFFFIFGHFIGQFNWLVAPLTNDLKQFFWAIPLALFGIPFILTMFIFPFQVILILYQKKLKMEDVWQKIFLCLAICIPWTFGDYIRATYPFGGFPWGLFGHFFSSSIFLQSLKYINIYIYSFFMMLSIFIPFFLFQKDKISKIFGILITLIFLGNTIFGATILLKNPIQKKSEILIIGSQANLDPHFGMTQQHAIDMINKNLENISLTKYFQKSTLILFPEATVNFPIDNGNSLIRTLSSIVPNENSLLLTGSISYDEKNNKVFNTIHAIDNDNTIIGIYNKTKLVPFGEYIPFRKYLPNFINTITGEMIDFAISESNDEIIYYRNLPYLIPIICYESIFSELIKKKVDKFSELIKQEGDISKDKIIINLTNDAWMKWSIGPYQHFIMSKFTAVRSNTAIIRLSNNGISALIDKYGRIINKTKLNTKDILIAEF